MDHAHHNHHDHQSGHGGVHEGHSPNMFKQKFWVSVALTIPAVVFSHAVQEWFGVEWTFPGSQYLSAVFGIILFFYGGMVFLKSAGAELRDKQPGMMTLISMAIIVAFTYSLMVTTGLVAGMDFWWELATLITIMLLGHWLEMKSVQDAEGALNELAKLVPDEVELLHGDHVMVVPRTQLAVGDSVLVRPGGQVPVDGVVVKGASHIDESLITGESKTVEKTIGREVIGGSLNTNGTLTVRVTRTGDETVLASVMKLVADAKRGASKAQILADKAARLLVVVALVAAVAAVIGWSIAGASAGFILERVVTILVIACPHALGLAVPLVVAISTTRAAKDGILVRKRSALEAARTVDVVLFDKTGTLTHGKQGVVAWHATHKGALALAAGVEWASEHPIAKAIMAYAKESSVTPAAVRHFLAVPGKGAQAQLEKTGEHVFVGSAALVRQQHAKIPTAIATAAEKAAQSGETVIYVGRNKEVLAAAVLADTIRPESKEAVQTLQRLGKHVAIVTGDSEASAAWVTSELGVDQYFAEVLPEDKSTIVRQLQAEGRTVAMVGDGINDAPALAWADVAIAMGAGTDAAIESAGVVLVSSDPRAVVRMVQLSKRTYAKMLQNIWWAAGYNIIAIPLAAGVGYAAGIIISPAIGAVLMSLSTIVVALNAQLLRRSRLN